MASKQKDYDSNSERVDDINVIKRGSEACFEDFPDGEVDLWSWNINGISSSFDQGILQAFIENKKPQVLCLQETKCDTAKLDKMLFYKKIPPGYA